MGSPEQLGLAAARAREIGLYSALPFALLLASCGANAALRAHAAAAVPDCPEPPVERVTPPADLRPRPPPGPRSEPLEIPRDWRALPGTPVLWRGPRARDVLVADTRTLVAVSESGITALAVDDGAVRWCEARPSIDRFRGHVIASLGVVLMGRPDGIVARDAESGSVVWHLDLATDDAWLDQPSVDGALLTARLDRGDASSYWVIDLLSGRVVSREPCDDECVSRISTRSSVRHAGGGVWEGHDADTHRLVWSRTLGEGSPLATLDAATLVVGGGAIQRVAHADGATEWSVPLPEEARRFPARALTAELGHVGWIPSTLAGHTLFLTLEAPVPLLLGLDVRDGAIVALQTLSRGQRRLRALDEQTAVAVDDQWRVVTIDLQHTVASPRESLSLEEDVARLVRALAGGSAPAYAGDFVSRVEGAETVPVLLELLSTAAPIAAARLARVLGRAREPAVRLAVLELLQRAAMDLRDDDALRARIEIADHVVFPIDERSAMREVAVFDTLVRALRAAGGYDPLLRESLRATRDLIERTSSSSMPLRALRATFDASSPTGELSDDEEIRLAAARHVLELGCFAEMRGEPSDCAALRSIDGAVARTREAQCHITNVARDGSEHVESGLWSDAPGAHATFLCTRAPGWETLRLRLVDGTWRVVSTYRIQF